MQSAKSGVSRVLGLPTRLISMPKAYIRSCHVLTVTGGKVTPKALIYSIAVIHSCLPLIFLNAVVSPLLISTFEGKVVPRAKPVSSTLKIASEE
jgi:hypothetical protein